MRTKTTTGDDHPKQLDDEAAEQYVKEMIEESQLSHSPDEFRAKLASAINEHGWD